MELTPKQREREVEVTKPNLAYGTICPGLTRALVNSSNLPFAGLGRPANGNKDTITEVIRIERGHVRTVAKPLLSGQL